MLFNQIQGVTKEESFDALKISVVTSMSFLGVNYGIIFILWFFMLSDTVLGIIKAATLGGWESLTRKKLLTGIGTKIAVLFIPLSLAVTGAFAGYNLLIFVNTTMWVLIANDAISCYTNILSIKKKKNYINKDLIELLVNSLRTLIYSGVKSALNRLKNNEICHFDDETDTEKSGDSTGRGVRPNDRKSDQDVL